MGACRALRGHNVVVATGVVEDSTAGVWVDSTGVVEVFTVEALLVATAMSLDATVDFVVPIAARDVDGMVATPGAEALLGVEAGVGR